MIKALERQEASTSFSQTQNQDDGDDQVDGLTPLQKARTSPSGGRNRSMEIDGLGVQGLGRAFTGTTLTENMTSVSPETTPSITSEEENHELGSPTMT